MNYLPEGRSEKRRACAGSLMVVGLKLDHPRQLAVDACSGPLCQHRCRLRLHHRRSLPTGDGRSRTSPVPILIGIAALRSLQTARQRFARKTAPLASLPSRQQGLFHLRALPQAIRAHLYSAHRRSPQAFRRAIATSPRPNAVNWTASINGSPTISTLSYPQSASRPLLNQSNENRILVSRCTIE